LDLVLYTTMGETGASWAGIALREESGLLRPAARRGAAEPSWTAGSFPVEGAEALKGPVAMEDAELRPSTRRLLAATGGRLMVPLRKDNQLIGLLVLGRPARRRGGPFRQKAPEAGGYGPWERSFLEALSISAAASIDNGRVYEELQRLNRRLSLKVYQLNSLFDITRELHRALDAPRVGKVLVASAMGQLLATRCLLVHPDGAIEVRGAKFSPARLDLLRTEAAKLKLPEEGMPVPELEGGPLKELLETAGFEMAVPIPSGSAPNGALLIGRKASGKPLGEEDVDFLRSLAAQGAAALDNLRLTREWVEKQKIEKEMALAREIQRALLPDRDPAIPGWDIAGINIPCLTVGGDYYDYLEGPQGKLGLAIADVSGKGTGPALLMAMVQASLRALSGLGNLTLGTLAARLNEQVYRSTEGNKYVTAFLGWLDPETAELTYLNAGHCYPLLFRQGGEVERLVVGGPVIGLLPEVKMEVGRTVLEKGGFLVLYTDGLSETRSPAGEEFLEERIIASVRAAQASGARQLVARLVSEARIFAAEAGLADDLTLMVVKRLSA
ncbi:MAG: GAF domain-containing SpoIIE family protein phosphatase, partial [Acidobacteriota bacterium]